MGTNADARSPGRAVLQRGVISAVTRVPQDEPPPVVDEAPERQPGLRVNRRAARGFVVGGEGSSLISFANTPLASAYGLGVALLFLRSSSA